MLSCCQWYPTDLKIEQNSSHSLTSSHLGLVPCAILPPSLCCWNHSGLLAFSFYLPVQTSLTVWRTLFTSASSPYINSCSFVRSQFKYHYSLGKHSLTTSQTRSENLPVVFLHTNPRLSLYFHLCEYLSTSLFPTDRRFHKGRGFVLVTIYTPISNIAPDT